MNLDDVGLISIRDVKEYLRDYKPRPFHMIDTETVMGKPYSIQTYNGIEARFQEVTPHSITDYFYDYVEKEFHPGMVLWVFNMSFDAPIIHFSNKKLFCYDEHDAVYGDHKVHYVSGKTWFADCTYKGEKYYVRDAYQFLYRSLEKSCKDLQIDIQKMKRPSWIGDRPPEGNAEKDYFKRYALTDVLALWKICEWIANIHRVYNVDISVSLADLCGKIFRKQYFEEGRIIRAPKSDVVLSSLLSYHGGKTECYIKTPALVRNIHTYDIKSAYPYAMTMIPNFFNYSVEERDFIPLNRNISEHGIYQVSGYTMCKYKCLYTHDFYHEDYIRKTWVTGYELKSAINCFDGVIHKGYIIHSDTTQKNTLIDYVLDFFIRKEKATNTTEKLWSKLALNALYGKFISRIVDEGHDGDEDKDDWSGGALFNPLIASCITGFVRGYVHKIEHRLNVYHTSTDGFISPLADSENLFPGRLDNGLGGLKKEYSGDALIFRRKLYVILDGEGKPLKHAAHGFFGDIDTLMELYRDRKIWYNTKRMTKLKESYRYRDPGRIAFSFHNQKRKIDIEWKDYYEM